MTEETVWKSIRVIPFDGKRKNYEMWAIRYLAKAPKMERDILKGTITAPAYDVQLDPNDDGDKERLKARKANEDAYASLLLACEDTVSFRAIANALTDELPDGDAALAWNTLKSLNRPTTVTEKQELIDEFTNCKLESKNVNPDVWLTELLHLRARLEIEYQYKKTDKEVREHILQKVPKEYNEVVRSIQRDINKGGDPSLDEVKADIREEYKLTCKNQGRDPDDENEDTEQALVTSGKGKKKFKGLCRVCGKQGHKGDDCWKLEKNKDKRPNKKSYSSDKKKGKCFYCKKSGHHKADCYKYKASKEKKQESEPEAAESAEVVLSGLEKSDLEWETISDGELDPDFFDYF